MIVAQLVEQSLPTPEVRSSNPVFGKLLYRTFICFNVNCIEKTKINKKEAGNVTFSSFGEVIVAQQAQWLLPTK